LQNHNPDSLAKYFGQPTAWVVSFLPSARSSFWREEDPMSRTAEPPE
jgi:hypothetical protein